MGEAKSARSVTENDRVENAPDIVDDIVFSLSILPPINSGLKNVTLEHVNAADTVMSLRQLIAEHPSLACYTSYHLEVENTGDNTWTPLNDFVELNEYPFISEGTNLKMVLEKYDARKARLHVRRLRDVLQNPPIPQSSEADTPSAGKKLGKKEKKKGKLDPSGGNHHSSSSIASKTNNEEQLKRLREIHEKLDGITIPVENELSNFYEMFRSSKKQNNKDPTRLTKLPICVKSVVDSGYNPPPGPRKLVGDLLYFEVTTEDDVVHHITAHVDGFYVNRSSRSCFDPRPRDGSCHFHLLLDVLCDASEKFKERYTILLNMAKILAQQGPSSIEWMLAAAGSNVGGKSPWIVAASESKKHEYDLNRAEDELCASYGMEERGVLRDWNEEYQCCRELPFGTLKEKLVRNRVMFKILNEFVDAATQGAVAIIEGHIPPINPMDDTSSHVYVFNNIFFSLAIDGQLNGKEEEEEAAYTVANRDLQGVKAFNQADIPDLHTLATVIVDFLGSRVIAQSVIPGILQGEAASKLVYGSVDGGKSIASNEKMHQLMVKAGKQLHIAERSMRTLGMQNVERDGSSDSSVGGETETETVVLCGPVEAKGILGSDGRFYVLDLVRITPKDWTFYSNNTVKGSDSDGAVCKRSHGYTAVLRPELIQLYSMWSQNKQNKKKLEREQNDAKKDKKTLTSLDTSKQDDLNNGMSDLQPVLFNPNVFMKYRAGVDSELVASDESLAKDAAEYLQQVVIPAFVSDIRSGAICPPDGNALTQLMHSCGINMRYLGRLAKLCKTLDIVGGISKFVLELLEIEMIARSTKHIIAKIMKDNDGARSAPGYTLIRVLNGIFGGIPANDADSDSNFKPNKNKKSKNKESTDTEILSCGIDVWECVNTEIKDRFGYELSLWTHEQTDADVNRTCKPALLRRVCQRIGLRIVSRKYHFSSAAPFSIDDIYAVVPVVKHSLPDHPLLEAKQLLERGRLHLSRGSLASSYELLQEASSLLYQVAGGAHEDSALCSSSLATVLYHAGDINGAISQQQRALALYSQLCGMDYHDTAFAHANLALFLHSSNQTENAVLHLRRAIYLLELCGGPHFPEVSSLYSRMGMMFQEVGQINLALLSHREALRRGEFDRLQAANTLHHMALACSLAGGNREALQYEKKVYSLYKETFGDEDPRTIESAKFMAKFTERAVEGAKGRKEIDAVAAANAVAEELLKELERDEGVKSRKSKKGKSSRKKN